MPITTEPKGPKPPVGGLIKVQFQYQQISDPSRRAANILHYSTFNATHTPTNTDLAAWVATLSSDWANALSGVLSTNWKIISATATMLDGSGNQGVDTTSHTGTASTVALPPGTSVVVTWKASGVSWRGGRPRTYLPGVTSGCQTAGDDSSITTSFASALVSQMKTYITNGNAIALAGGTTNLTVVSYFSKGAFRIPPQLFPISAPVVHQRLASQRRRSGKEGTFLVSS